MLVTDPNTSPDARIYQVRYFSFTNETRALSLTILIIICIPICLFVLQCLGRMLYVYFKKRSVSSYLDFPVLFRID